MRTGERVPHGAGLVEPISLFSALFPPSQLALCAETFDDRVMQIAFDGEAFFHVDNDAAQFEIERTLTEVHEKCRRGRRLHHLRVTARNLVEHVANLGRVALVGHAN
jgi:hypothetical protein